MNLEHIKCIITTDYVLVLNADEENVVAFIEELQRRLSPPKTESLVPKLGSNGDLNGEALNLGSKLEIEETPFELRALEVALDMVRSFKILYSKRSDFSV